MKFSGAAAVKKYVPSESVLEQSAPLAVEFCQELRHEDLKSVHRPIGAYNQISSRVATGMLVVGSTARSLHE